MLRQKTWISGDDCSPSTIDGLEWVNTMSWKEKTRSEIKGEITTSSHSFHIGTYHAQPADMLVLTYLLVILGKS